MEQNEYSKNAHDMIYLVSCALNGETPDRSRIDSMDLDKVYEVSQSHVLSACTAYALESAGIHDHNFTQAKEKAIRKNILFDTERKKILDRLEKEKIWYMPLKGAILKDLYPKLGMRQMSDNDILCDKTKRKKIRIIMKDLGFTMKGNASNVDEFTKPPVFNFEMHGDFFNIDNAGANNAYNYYKNIRSRLIKDKDSDYGYHLSDEDFYIYLLAHEYKHYCAGGTGIRSLADTYIFLKKNKDKLNHNYINRELQKLGMVEYEAMNRRLSMKVFGNESLTAEDREELEYYILSEAYGTVSHNIDNLVNKVAHGDKRKYFFRWLFPSMDHYQKHFPWAYKHKWLIPAAWVFRILRGLTKRRKRVTASAKYLVKEINKR